jgi:hypothetical protein
MANAPRKSPRAPFSHFAKGSIIEQVNDRTERSTMMTHPPTNSAQRIEIHWFPEQSREILVKQPPLVSRIISQLLSRPARQESAAMQKRGSRNGLTEELPR